MESKSSMRFKDNSLYDVIANHRATGRVKVFEERLTYEQVLKLDANGYKKWYKVYHRFRVICTNERDPMPKKARIGLRIMARCNDCGKEFEVESAVIRHVSVFRHTVTLAVHHEFVFTPNII